MPTPSPGLCERCRHGRTVRGARSVFWRCELASTDPSFPRYPTLPVRECRGFEAADPTSGRGGASATPRRTP